MERGHVSCSCSDLGWIYRAGKRFDNSYYNYYFATSISKLEEFGVPNPPNLHPHTKNNLKKNGVNMPPLCKYKNLPYGFDQYINLILITFKKIIIFVTTNHIQYKNI